VWKAPGGVVIDQGTIDASASLADGSPSAGAKRTAGFRPGPPSPLKRARRPMPEIGDFPEVGQRDYHSKADAFRKQSGGPRRSDGASSSALPRKRGLLQRLVDAGRGRHPVEDVEPDVSEGNERPLPEDPTMPAFVKRDRR
jgi:hypothetical protein